MSVISIPNLSYKRLNTDNEIRIAVYLFEQFCFLSFSAFVELLLAPKHSENDRQVTASWFTSASKEPLNSFGLKTILPMKDLKDTSNFDAIILIGGPEPINYLDKNLKKWISSHLHRNRPIYACGSATEALIKLGFLDNRKVAVHHDTLERLKRKYPTVSFKETIFEFDQGILTFATGSACIDAFATLATQVFSKDKTNEIFRHLLTQNPRNAGQLQRSTLETLIKHKNSVISKAGTFMSQNLMVKQTGLEISKHIGISRRQLERLFKKHIGISPGRCYLAVRLELALERLKETNLTTEEVVKEFGFRSNDQFYSLFRKRYGVSLFQKLSAFGQLVPQED